MPGIAARVLRTLKASGALVLGSAEDVAPTAGQDTISLAAADIVGFGAASGNQTLTGAAGQGIGLEAAGVSGAAAAVLAHATDASILSAALPGYGIGQISLAAHATDLAVLQETGARTPQGSQVTLSDGTQITFAGIVTGVS